MLLKLSKSIPVRTVCYIIYDVFELEDVFIFFQFVFIDLYSISIFYTVTSRIFFHLFSFISIFSIMIDFSMSNPNRARSLINSFAGNMVHFHARDGGGYKFIGDCIIELDAMNPQVAARLTG